MEERIDFVQEKVLEVEHTRLELAVVQAAERMPVALVEKPVVLGIAKETDLLKIHIQAGQLGKNSSF